jgi:DNA-binding transcriptional MerR regulator
VASPRRPAKHHYERIVVRPASAARAASAADATRRLQILAVAKRAGFTLDEARTMLRRADAGTPAFESLRELAARNLPEVDALVARAEAMRAWLLSATDCSCTTLDVCARFDTDAHAGPRRRWRSPESPPPDKRSGGIPNPNPNRGLGTLPPNGCRDVTSPQPCALKARLGVRACAVQSGDC